MSSKPGPGEPLQSSLQTGPSRTCFETGGSNRRPPPLGLALGGEQSLLAGRQGQEAQQMWNVSRGRCTALSLWFPSLSQMQIMWVNSEGSCVLCAGGGKGPGAREVRCPTEAMKETAALPHLPSRMAAPPVPRSLGLVLPADVLP